MKTNTEHVKKLVEASTKVMKRDEHRRTEV